MWSVLDLSSSFSCKYKTWVEWNKVGTGNGADESQQGCPKDSVRFCNLESWCFPAFSRTQVKPLSCPTLCDPMDCSPPGSSVHGILQARTLEWVAISWTSVSSFFPSLCVQSCWTSCPELESVAVGVSCWLDTMTTKGHIIFVISILKRRKLRQRNVEVAWAHRAIKGQGWDLKK